ncbi:hypothetical protein CEUSTIGMA_g9812.t1 [Chlamydomonas eustigma]|uniref:Zinc-binding loop region of homing endonuclease domain-containing protein n=1 Tax=Chlamydomonas eustigma TaxID=1157962 RepID=A0A250XH28_9CHLO|nr:hypothetical protein CEUSTIGMA_g9812.t1 [Chlamydomonas eustigma]|eukprot:GAX82384.1 hypothetical protein CEUSTIGMA_g9812.t1 [Chlamydomonas eustigma]
MSNTSSSHTNRQHEPASFKFRSNLRQQLFNGVDLLDNPRFQNCSNDLFPGSFKDIKYWSCIGIADDIQNPEIRDIGQRILGLVSSVLKNEAWELQPSIHCNDISTPRAQQAEQWFLHQIPKDACKIALKSYDRLKAAFIAATDVLPHEDILSWPHHCNQSNNMHSPLLFAGNHQVMSSKSYHYGHNNTTTVVQHPSSTPSSPMKKQRRPRAQHGVIEDASTSLCWPLLYPLAQVRQRYESDKYELLALLKRECMAKVCQEAKVMSQPHFETRSMKLHKRWSEYTCLIESQLIADNVSSSFYIVPPRDLVERSSIDEGSWKLLFQRAFHFQSDCMEVDFAKIHGLGLHHLFHEDKGYLRMNIGFMAASSSTSSSVHVQGQQCSSTPSASLVAGPTVNMESVGSSTSHSALESCDEKGNVVREYVHQIVYYLFFGGSGGKRASEKNKNEVIMHVCHNRSCLNPMHLCKGAKQPDNLQMMSLISLQAKSFSVPVNTFPDDIS